MKFKQKWNNYEDSSSCAVDYFKETVFTEAVKTFKRKRLCNIDNIFN